MSKGKRLLYILAGFLVALVIGYFIFTGTQVEPVELPETDEEMAVEDG